MELAMDNIKGDARFDVSHI